jgi:hypothetical protein
MRDLIVVGSNAEVEALRISNRHLQSFFCTENTFCHAPAAWSSGAVCRIMGREIESRRGEGWYLVKKYFLTFFTQTYKANYKTNYSSAV